MNQAKRKPLLNRKETQTLLKSIKLASTAGALSLTLAGWGLLAQLDANSAQAASNQPVAMIAAANAGSIAPPPKLQPTPVPNTQQVRKLDIVQWVQDIQGNAVAVVRDKRGSLWYVMGDDVTRLEQGFSPQVQPQPVQVVTRTRAS